MEHVATGKSLFFDGGIMEESQQQTWNHQQQELEWGRHGHPFSGDPNIPDHLLHQSIRSGVLS